MHESIFLDFECDGRFGDLDSGCTQVQHYQNYYTGPESQTTAEQPRQSKERNEARRYRRRRRRKRAPRKQYLHRLLLIFKPFTTASPPNRVCARAQCNCFCVVVVAFNLFVIDLSVIWCKLLFSFCFCFTIFIVYFCRADCRVFGN